MSRHFWTEQEDAILRAAYPDTPTAALAATLGVSVRSLYGRAIRLGLRKSAAYLSGPHACRLRRSDGIGERNRFAPGMTPWNKGVHFVAGGRSGETRFKPGRPASAARNYRPIGSLRLSKDGILERKVTDDPAVYPARRWVAEHRLVWEAAHGLVPAGHLVRFKRGMRTVEPGEITLDRLELVSRAENMARNSVQNYGHEVARAVQLLGALNRKINARKESQ
jgi:hypothetical protein